MTSNNKNLAPQDKTTFSVAKELIYPNLKTEDFPLENSKKSRFESVVPNVSKYVNGISPAAIKKIEAKLKLTFLLEKDMESQVCMANNPEVRDEFKDIFDKKDLLDYIYAVLHSPNYLKKYQDVSKIKDFQIAYPKDSFLFWRLVDLGSKLRDRKLLGAASEEKHNHETKEILKKITELETE